MAIIKKQKNWIELTNPLRWLTSARIVQLLEALNRGEMADVQWAFASIEESDPDMVALLARSLGPLKAMDYDVKCSDDEDAAALAEAQEAQLESAYTRLENLRETIAHLAMAKFRGFAVCQCQDANGQPAAPGVATQLACLDQWNFARDGRRGAFKWNPNGDGTPFDALPAENLLDPKRDFLIIRECARPVDRIALVKFVRSNFTQKAWADFIETAARQGVAMIEPNGLGSDADAKAAFRNAADAYAEGNSVALPFGSLVQFANAARGELPFESHMRFLREQLILAGTGGLLTMLAEPTGIGQGASGTHADAFAEITAGEALEISECFQKHFDKQVLQGAQPAAYFALAAREETSPSAILADAKTARDAGFQLDPDEISEKSGYTLTTAAPAPNPFAPFNPAPAADPVTDPAPVVGRVTDPANPEQPVSPSGMNRRSSILNSQSTIRNSSADNPIAGQFLAAARLQLSQAQQAALYPVAKRLNQLYHAAEGQTPDQLQAALIQFRDVELPAALKQLAVDPATTTVLQDIIGTSLVAGYTGGTP